jgi:hypothetical protein
MGEHEREVAKAWRTESSGSADMDPDVHRYYWLQQFVAPLWKLWNLPV